MSKVLLLTLLISTVANATPGKFEVWFLSIDKQSVFKQFSTEKSDDSLMYSATGELQCEPMGEYCFDPQVGLYKNGESASAREVGVDASELEKNQKYDFMETGDSVNNNLINCDKKNQFDIFCGSSKKKALRENIQLEVWVDISTTMKQVDYAGLEGKCTREIFLEGLNKTCPMNQKLKVYYFNESRKEAGSFDRVCLANGLNNMKRLLTDVERVSKNRNLVIVTDIFEASQSFITQIEALGGKVKGLDTPVYAKDLLKDLSRINKLCK